MTLREETLSLDGVVVWVRVCQLVRGCPRCLIEMRAVTGGESCCVDALSPEEASRLLPAALAAFAGSMERRGRERRSTIHTRC
jgi:hypothetical protein